VHPAALRARRREHLRQRFPEAQRPVADRQLGVDAQATLLHVQQEALPRLLALAVAVGHRDQLLPAFRGRPHQHEDTSTIFLQADVEVDAVGPDVDVTLVRQIAGRPPPVVLLPGLLQAHHRRGRQPRAARPEQRRQRLAEVAGRYTLKVQPGDQLFDRLGLAQVWREDRRGEPLTRVRWPTVMHPWSGDFDRPDARHHRPRRSVAVADHLAMALFIGDVGVVVDPLLHLGLDRLGQQRPGPLTDHVSERIAPAGSAPAPGSRVGRGWKSERFMGSLTHGGVLLGVRGRACCNSPKVRRLFQCVIHNIRLYPPYIS